MRPSPDGGKEAEEKKSEPAKEKAKDEKHSQPHPHPIYLKPGSETVAEMVKRIQSGGAKSLHKEFHRLRVQSGAAEGLTDEVSKANPRKNRYPDVGVWDQTRVKLSLQGDEKSDYIHASWVDGVTQPRRYILTQGPMEALPDCDDTADDFWRMVWEQGIVVILMLCQPTEDGRPKCSEYWPTKRGTAQIRGRFAVYCKDFGTRHIGDHIIYLTNLILTAIDGRKGQRQLCHYVHGSWPDRKCPPSAAPIVDFLLKVEKAQKKLVEQEQIDLASSPLLVHCSAGVGRTGTLVAIHIGMSLLSLPKPTIDVPHIVYQLRRFRRFSVQTPVQYLCIYQALLEFLHHEGRLNNFNMPLFNREIVALTGPPPTASNAHS